MAHLVSDHISLGKVASGLEALGHFLEETHVQIDFLVCRAIKRPAGRGCKAAGRIDLAAKQHQGRVFVRASGLLKNLTPCVFRIAQHCADKIGLFIIGRRCTPCLLSDLGRGLPGELAA